MDKGLFFLRSYNDVDHIVPIIYKWLSINKNVLINIVFTDDKRLINDYRINYLSQFDNLCINDIDDNNVLSKYVKFLETSLYSKSKESDNAK